MFNLFYICRTCIMCVLGGLKPIQVCFRSHHKIPSFPDLCGIGNPFQCSTYSHSSQIFHCSLEEWVHYFTKLLINSSDSWGRKKRMDPWIPLFLVPKRPKIEWPLSKLRTDSGIPWSRRSRSPVGKASREPGDGTPSRRSPTSAQAVPHGAETC